MTETSHDSRTAWTKHFVDELQLRHVDQKEIDTALESVREHLDDSGETPDDAFGDPREYAASLKLPARDEGFGRPGSYAAIGLTVVSFIVFGIAVLRWFDHGATPAVIGWTIAGTIGLLTGSIWMTIGLARHIVEATLRQRFKGSDAQLWGRWGPVAIAIPWVFPTFAAAIVLICALLR